MDKPPPDPTKLLEAWMEWERGETPPGRVMATLKTGGLRDLLEELEAAGWVSSVAAAGSPGADGGSSGADAGSPGADTGSQGPDAGSPESPAAEAWTPVV